MRIKKFEAVTLQEALSKIKKDFGPEAVILHTKKFKRGGIFGLFGRETTEVTAGIDINIDRPRQQQQQQQQQPAQYEKPSPQIPSLSAQFGGKIQPAAARQQPAQPRLEPMGHVYNRVEDISMKNDTLARELSEGKVSLSGTLRPSRDNSGSSMQGPALKSGIGRIQKMLIDNGVEESLVYRTLQNINSQLTDAQINNKVFIEQYLYDYISNMVQVSGPIKTTPGTSKVVAFIGPTGVGKTTTIAKLAAKYALIEGKSVVMITADTYRIAADLQLKKYGEIMGIPVEIVLTPDDFKKVINKHLDKDLIFFDTAGRSPRNRQHLSELKEFLEVHTPIETHIVISAVTKYFDALSIINNFGMVPIHRMLFTKLDETKNYGMLLNLSVGSGGIPISFLTVGQNVPDDLEIADPKAISRLVIKGDFEAWIRQRG
jgi:flagellar biosynthesis protein FlhF